MKKKHFNIPIFIPELACPFQCIYCNQQKISGLHHLPGAEEINNTIMRHLTTIPEQDTEVQVAYFGGNFTGIPLAEQEKYLQIVQPYIKSGRITGIRLSTRPDYINEQVLDLLKKYQVQSIELGAQSMDDGVLKKSRRGHTVAHTEKASRLIHEYGFSLSLQMMIGLPGDSLDSALMTARGIIGLGAVETRIYPTLVIRDTVMAQLFMEGRYTPLTLDDAVSWSALLLLEFEAAKVQILKLGLHPSEGLLSGDELIAGPFHPSFRELVLTKVWADIFDNIDGQKDKDIEIFVATKQINAAIGYRAKNRLMLEQKFRQVSFKSSDELRDRNFEFSLL